MSTPENELRRLLHEQPDLPLRGDGLTVIRTRVQRRRRRRVVLLPSAVLAVTGALVVVAVLGGGGGLRSSLEQEQPAGPSATAVRPSGSPSARPSASASAAPTGTPNGPPASGEAFSNLAIWPFPTAALAAGWRPGGAYPWAEQSAEVTRRFLTEHLGLAGLTVVGDCPDCTSQVVRNSDNTQVGVAALASARAGGRQVWTVTGVGGGDLAVTTPPAGAAIPTPTTVTGRITGVDESIRLRLLTPSGTQLAQVFTPAGTDAPWQASLAWTDTAWTQAALIATTGTARDGTLNRLVAVPVSRSTGTPTSGSSFAGLVDGHVALLDGRSGATLRQLTFPAAGKADTGATYAAGALAWVRSSPTGCADELDRLDQGQASTVVKAGTFRLASPQLSPSGALLAWRQQPCAADSPMSVVVRSGGAPDRVLAAPTGMSADLRDLRDDGALLVHLNDLAATDAGTLVVVPPGADTFDQAVPLAPTGSCYLAGAAAFDGATPVVWETCGPDSRLVRFGETGTRASAGPLVAGLATPASTSIRGGVVLVQRAGDVARYSSGAVTVLAVGVRAADW